MDEKLGDYRLIKSIGQGVFGKVYLAEHLYMQRYATLKVLSSEKGRDRAFVDRLQREMAAVSSVDHPHVAKIQAVSFAEGKYFLVTDYVPSPHGGEPMNLNDYLREVASQEPLKEQIVLSLAKQLASALDAIHQKSVSGLSLTHLALRPSNILVTNMMTQPRFILTDAGITKVLGVSSCFDAILEDMRQEGGTNEQSLETKRSRFVQNYNFLAPEQKNSRDDSQYSFRCDTYAFGVLLYYLLVRCYPEGVFSLPSLQRNLVLNWDHLIMRLLKQDPQQRAPATAGTLLDEINQMVGQGTKKASPQKQSAGDAAKNLTRPDHRNDAPSVASSSQGGKTAEPFAATRTIKPALSPSSQQRVQSKADSLCTDSARSQNQLVTTGSTHNTSLESARASVSNARESKTCVETVKSPNYAKTLVQPKTSAQRDKEFVSLPQVTSGDAALQEKISENEVQKIGSARSDSMTSTNSIRESLAARMQINTNDPTNKSMSSGDHSPAGIAEENNIPEWMRDQPSPKKSFNFFDRTSSLEKELEEKEALILGRASNYVDRVSHVGGPGAILQDKRSSLSLRDEATRGKPQETSSRQNSTPNAPEHLSLAMAESVPKTMTTDSVSATGSIFDNERAQRARSLAKASELGTMVNPVRDLEPSLGGASAFHSLNREPVADSKVEPMLSDMVQVKGGAFTRGSNGGSRDEMPVHQVEITDFYLDTHPVTNEQFLRFLQFFGAEKDESNNDMIRLKESRIKRHSGKLIVEAGYAKHPIVGVTWYGAKAYCHWVGKRLPTEAEWEVAARGSDSAALYPCGEKIEKQQANFFNSDTTPVKSYPPNGLGLFDMAGNVYEWCADWYAYNTYEVSASEPYCPKGPVQGVYRVLRGGCWKSLKEDLRCTHRHRNNPGAINRTYGFRCASDVEAVVSKVVKKKPRNKPQSSD